MISHQWILGWKQHFRVKGEIGYFVDICRRCGVGHMMGLFTEYIPASQVQTFLTTYKPVDFYEYLPCENSDV